MGTVVRPRPLTLLWVVPAVLLCTVASTACGQKVEAKTPDRPVALAAPAPPGRTVVQVSVEPTPTPVPAETPVSPPPPTRPPGGRGAQPPPTPVTTAPPPVDPPAPPVLQTGSSQADLAKGTRDRLEWAERDLKLLSGRTLSKDAQAQYDSAKSFIRLANSALAAKNFIYAHFCADKAATLAALLVK